MYKVSKVNEQNIPQREKYSITYSILNVRSKNNA